MPDRETVQKIRETLKTSADYVFFFERLKSPAWIQPLTAEGFFSEPPAAQEGANGGVRFQQWPESQYLARIAEQAPEAVVEVILRMPHTDNPNVHRDVTAAALKVPPKLAARLVGLLLEWIESPYSKWLHYDSFGRLLAYLAKGGEAEAALKLAQSLLELVPDPEEHRKRSAADSEDIIALSLRLEPHPKSEMYVYQEILENAVPPLLNVAPLKTIALLASLLDRAIALGKHDPQTENGQDWSIMWFPTLANPSHRIEYDPKAALAASLVRCTDEVLGKIESLYPEIEVILRSYHWRIFERLLMRIASQHPVPGRETLRRFILDLRRYEGTDFNHEYFELVQKHFGLLSESERSETVRFILEGPDIRRFVGNQKSWGAEPTPQEIRRYRERWKVLRLYPIKDFLSEAESRTYAELSREAGEPTPRSYIHYQGVVETSWGPHSPKTEQELSEAKPSEILDFLKTWESVKGFNTPSVEGLARAFQQAVIQHGSEYSTQASEFVGIEPAYIRALILGLAETVKKQEAIDWAAALALCDWVVRQPVEIEGRSEEKWDWEAGEPNWRGTRKAVASLIQNGARRGAAETPFSLRPEVFAILNLLTQDTEPTPEYENQGGWKDQPATLAINTVRGEAMHALFAHALWVHRHLPEDEPKTLAAMPEVRRIMEQRLDVTIEPTRAIRSAFGQYLPYICHIDVVWTQEHLASIFPHSTEHKALRDAAWNTYVTFNQPRAEVFKALADEYKYAIEHLGEPKGTEHDVADPDEALAEHLIVLYWWNVLDFEGGYGLLDRFYSRASDQLRAHIVTFVGRALDKDPVAPPQDFLKRMRKFWEFRLNQAKQNRGSGKYAEELLAFAWWLHSGKFDAKWSLTQTAEVLNLCETVNHEFLFTKPLAHLSSEFPVEAAQCLLLLIERLSPDRLFVLDRDDVRTIVERAFGSKQPGAIEMATTLRDSLLARGQFGFREVGLP